MKNEITAICSIGANALLSAMTGADVRDEVSAWVTQLKRNATKVS